MSDNQGKKLRMANALRANLLKRKQQKDNRKTKSIADKAFNFDHEEKQKNEEK